MPKVLVKRIRMKKMEEKCYKRSYIQIINYKRIVKRSNTEEETMYSN